MKIFRLKRAIFRKLHGYQERDGKVYLRFRRSLEWRFKPVTSKPSGKEYTKQALYRWRAENEKALRHNGNVFGKWITRVLKYTAPRPLEEGELFACQGVLLHRDNNAYLSTYIDSWSFLDYSPEADDTLSLTEVKIERWFEKDRNFS